MLLADCRADASQSVGSYGPLPFRWDRRDSMGSHQSASIALTDKKDLSRLRGGESLSAERPAGITILMGGAGLIVEARAWPTSR
jgi:hypothetical protein